MADRYFDPERWRYADDDRYRDEWRRSPRYQDRDQERGWFDRERGRAWGEREWRPEYGRGWQGRTYDRDDRGFWDRFGDEVRSWFGDEEAQRRRMMDDGVDWTERRGRPWEERRSWSDRPLGSERRWWDDRSSWDRPRWPSDDVSRPWGYVDRGETVGRYGQGFPGGVTGGYEPSGGTEYYGQASPMSGPFTGRGPRGWQRSDERIKEDVCERMSHHGGLDASDLEVRVSNCEVTLAGSVPDREAKRIAEHIAESVSGVRDVHNQIRVSGGTGEPQQSTHEGQQRSWPDQQQRRIA